MRDTNKTKIGFDNIPVAKECSFENPDDLRIVDPYQSDVVVSEEFTGLCFDQPLQAPAELMEVIDDNYKTYNVLAKLGASHSQIENLSVDDLKIYNKYKEILKNFGVFELTFEQIQTFSESRLEKFSQHLNLFNDLKEYMDKMKTWIDEDKANKIKKNVKNFILQPDDDNLNKLIKSLKKKSELTHPFFYIIRFSCVFSERGSHLADRIDKDITPLLNNGQPNKSLGH